MPQIRLDKRNYKEMKRVKIICVFFVCTLFLVSCAQSQTSQNAENLFKEMHKECPMNETLRLSKMEPMYIGDEDFKRSTGVQRKTFEKKCWE
jgi:hypothetical protein